MGVWLAAVGIGMLNCVTDLLKPRRPKDQLQSGLRIELTQLRFVMGGIVLAFEAQAGALTESFLHWYRPIVVDYIDHCQHGMHMAVARDMLDTIDATLNVRIDPATMVARRIAQIMLQERARDTRERGVASRLKTYSAPLLDAKLGALAGPGGEFVGDLLAVKQQLGWFNDEVERMRRYQQRHGRSQENHGRAGQNEAEDYGKAKDQARRVADLIGRINWP